MRLGWIVVLGAAGCHWVFELEPTPIEPPPPNDWTQVAAGLAHSCGIRSDATLWCWGGNELGEVGVNSGELQVDEPTRVGTGETWLAVSTRYRHTCAIRADHSLWCWGANDQSQLGTGNATGSSQPLRIGEGWKAVTAGWGHTCGIRDDDTLACWGANGNGQLGHGNVLPRPLPTPVGSSTWIAIGTGQYHTCGIKTGGSLWCWGDNAHGTYGDGSNTQSQEPREVPGDSWKQIALGATTTCGLTAGDRVRCTGFGAHGELGDDVTFISSSFIPVKIDGVEPEWNAIAVGAIHACGITRDGSLWCWGDDIYWQLGSEVPAGFSSRPLRIAGAGASWRAIAPGVMHSCAIDGDGRAWCFGADSRSQLGDGGSSHPVPTRVGTYVTMAAGTNNTCAIDSNGKPRCAGSNSSSQIGDGTSNTRDRLTSLDTTVTGWTSLVVGTSHACGSANGAWYCWGANGSGQFGDSTTTPQKTPTATGGTWPVLVGTDHMCGLDGGFVSCWGYNNVGQVGNGTIIDTPSPSGLANPNVAAVSVGSQHACTLDTAGSALCWGRNFEGQLANTAAWNYSTSPVSVNQSSTGAFEAIHLGGNHTCARTADHHLWCWGSNSAGQLGVGDSAPRSFPVELGTAEWTAVVLGSSHTCGIQTDGTLWCWGNGLRGQLGLGSRSSRFVPVQVTDDVDWIDVIAGASHTCARKMDDSMWCWGSNDYGQLGDGTAWHAPQLVP
ncbi:MAG TPA: hypothetical protein VIU61_27545 [Kofleriaceae bacterium]